MSQSGFASSSNFDTIVASSKLITPIGANLGQLSRTLVPTQGAIAYDTTSTKLFYGITNDWVPLNNNASTGDVIGDTPSVDGTLVTYNGTDGKHIQNTSSITSVGGMLSGVTGINGSPLGNFQDSNFSVVDATDQTKSVKFDVQGSTSTTTTIVTNPTVNRNFITPDIDGKAIVEQTGTNMVFIGGPVGQLHGSNAGIQYSTDVTNRAQIRLNLYGANGGGPGMTSFKSRSNVYGGLAPIIPGDSIYRLTAIGVTDNLSIPLSGSISINVPTNGVPVGQGYIATEYELQLVSLDGPSNGRRVVHKITSEGVPQLLETTSPGSHTTVPSGLITLGGAGNIIVPNNKIPSNARIILTVQPGPAPIGNIYVSNITPNTSFTITSTAGGGDTGVNVYYQIYIPL
jgi:hypothetical protein